MSDLNKKEESVVRRAGDSGLGVPEFEPVASRPLSAAEIAAHQQAVDAALREKAEAMLAELELDEGWRLPAPIRRFCAYVLVLLAAVLGLFMVTQVVQFFAEINALPPWSQGLAIGGLVLFGGALAVVLFQLLWGVVRLQRSPRIHLKAMTALAERRQMQFLAAEKQADARRVLMRYLRDYPVEKRSRMKLLAMGLSEPDWESLLTARDQLLDADRTQSDADWLAAFGRSFQGALDKLARRRIKQYARRAGIGTAASPVAMVDQLVVLFSCTAMVKDLFVLYHLRPAFGQTAVILARSVVLTYLSGMIEETAETVADATADSLADFMGESASVLTGAVGRAVGAKTAEAALNGLLIWRLGKRAMGQLQPIRK
jgi:uncharacterized membrane protein YcjF (UPF0283 family)